MADRVIKVLIVDDIPETREMLRKLLAFETDIAVVDTAATGREGLELTAEHKPDIVMMDINMPDMDGIQATEEIKRILPTAGVIMMSVQSDANYLRRAMVAGARDFLSKPISHEDMIKTIHTVYDLIEPERIAAANRPDPANSQINKKQEGGHIIAFYSPQGGAGVTTLATNTAVSLMREGTRVLLIDADLQFGDVGVFLNLQSKYTLTDIAGSVADVEPDLVESMTAKHGSGLKVLLSPASPEEAERIPAEDIPSIISQTAQFYDYIIVDLPHRLDDMTLGIMDMAERIVLVATPTLPAVKNSRIVLDVFLALEYELEKIMFVMNRVVSGSGGRAAIPVEAIENNLKRNTDGRIPLDEKAFLSAVNQGVSVIANDQDRSPASDLIGLAENIRRSVSDDEPELPTDDQQNRRSSRLSGIFGRN